MSLSRCMSDLITPMPWLVCKAQLLQAAGHQMGSHFQEDGPAAASMGVFVGIQQMEYGTLAAPFLSKMGPFTATGGPFSVAAGRISFTFGLKGPAVSSSCSQVQAGSVVCLPWVSKLHHAVGQSQANQTGV